MPIHEAIYNVLFKNVNPKECVQKLMTRTLTDEHRDIT
jgi:glycerol-3-phosphate dehydrogenase